jgi:phosphatidylglycerol:prolipoprotein diacylglycerol transferase
MYTTFPTWFNPVALQLGPIAIHWYGIAYALGAILGYLLITRLNRTPPHALSLEALDTIMTAAILGIVVGGRLGYVVWYKTSMLWQDPLSLFYIWKGGMSFHGGVLGLVLAMYWLCRRYRLSFLPVTDLIVTVAPIGIFLGRLANFINGELYGRVTNVPWAFVFPYSDGQPRHPSQLYEAAGEGILLGIIMYLLATRTKARTFPGLLSAIFLLIYAAIRFGCEYFREPDAHLGHFWWQLTMGQLLTLPMCAVAAYLLWRLQQRTYSR